MLIVSCLTVLAVAQDYNEYSRPAPSRLGSGNGPAEVRPTPVPIVKQINRHNEDGSYTYGYEGGDGSFKIETKLANGEVKGKYGYVDETGKVRVVEYGADRYGFQPSGEGITVAPPTLVDETTDKNGQQINDYDEVPQVPQHKLFAQNNRASRPQPAPQPRPQPRPQQQLQYVEYEEEPQQQYQPQPAPQPRPQYSPAPVPPRAQIAGAAPANDVVYAEKPRPARPDFEYTQRQTFAAPQSSVRLSQPSFAPAPEARAYQAPKPIQQQPQYTAPRASAPRPQPQGSHTAPSGQQVRGVSVLDQLARDYALPAGGSQPLHDISFGYY